MRKSAVFFFNTQSHRWILALLMAIHAGVYTYFALIPDLRILPSNPDFQVISYTDQSQGGRSVITNQVQNDSFLKIEYTLHRGFSSPYIGFTICDSQFAPVDLSGYNQIHIDVSTEHLNGIVITFFTTLPASETSGKPEEIWYQKIVELQQGQTRYSIALDQLKMPDWWVERNHLDEQNVPPLNLSAIRNINIGTAYFDEESVPASMTIYGVTLYRDNRQILVYLLISLTSIYTVWLLIFWYKNRKETITISPIKIEYQPVSTPAADQDLHSILQYINAHFHEAELTIEQVAEATGYNTRRISGIIQDHVQSNFKTYLNTLRITESKRLLTTTDLNIGEVAYKVGFSNQSHFNRVFKSMEKRSPSQYKSNPKSE